MEIEKRKCKFLEQIMEIQNQQNAHLGTISQELKRLSDIIIQKSTLDNLFEL